ncbi:hypothetical protein TNCV_4063141 [Trichonephila clavipes]|nr:hypothetical protein TNCV_4063141 [Trichonephila clavipes]
MFRILCLEHQENVKARPKALSKPKLLHKLLDKTTSVRVKLCFCSLYVESQFNINKQTNKNHSLIKLLQMAPGSLTLLLSFQSSVSGRRCESAEPVERASLECWDCGGRGSVKEFGRP